MEKTVAVLRTNRTYYSIEEAAKDSITVEEFIEWLRTYTNLEDKIVFSNDNGYTYGYIKDKVITEKTYETSNE